LTVFPSAAPLLAIFRDEDEVEGTTRELRKL
jgi:hypothetical protein